MLVSENLWYNYTKFGSEKLKPHIFEQYKTRFGFKWEDVNFEEGKTYYLHFECEVLEGAIESIGGHSTAYERNAFYINGVKKSPDLYSAGIVLNDDEKQGFTLDLEFEKAYDADDKSFYIQFDRTSSGFNDRYLKFKLKNYYITTEKEAGTTIIPIKFISEENKEYHKLGKFNEIQSI